jgi:hypothetical protein
MRWWQKRKRERIARRNAQKELLRCGNSLLRQYDVNKRLKAENSELRRKLIKSRLEAM